VIQGLQGTHLYQTCQQWMQQGRPVKKIKIKIEEEI
jgi:hypothetical protein